MEVVGVKLRGSRNDDEIPLATEIRLHYDLDPLIPPKPAGQFRAATRIALDDLDLRGAEDGEQARQMKLDRDGAAADQHGLHFL